ncbi:hypothetical protein N1851_028941 [Merluccius polli]|uniref:DUF4524 domain-containing protein n=1 Tax=Merluccius polli TaxID=89951 RepID=A0AA47NR45_MERPO|nr:hypothetical protein N1851_028941 [Merluccius polli]
MAANTNVSLMVMYEDESVYVRYCDGSKLHVSPCGSEFVVVKAADRSAHPLQATEQVRQRTRFAISTYKELMQGALVFRNSYAARPYLPHELIPAVDKKPFFSVDSEADWPRISSCGAERGPGGDTTVRSVEGRATLTLSSSGEDFLVEFLCSVGKPAAIRNASREDPVTEPKETTRMKPPPPPQSTVLSPSKSEEIYECTTVVVQHHSCSSVAPMWRYPLSVARHHWATHRRATPGGPGAGEESATTEPTEAPDDKDRRCPVPEALPLRCPSPHQHRWKVKDPLMQGDECPDQDFPGELMKVMWCQGVIYRILSGPISVIEVSPGDGSVIRSNNVLSSYFTHYKYDSHAGQVKEVTYLVNSLPPDVPGQVYSIRSIVSRASRILTCYNQARVSLRLSVMPSCLEQVQDVETSLLKSIHTVHIFVYLELNVHCFCVQESNRFEPVTFEENLPSSVSLDSRFNLTQTEHSRSDIVSAELEKIKRFNYGNCKATRFLFNVVMPPVLLENSKVPRVQEEGSAELRCGSRIAKKAASEPVDETYIAEALQRTNKAIQDIDAVISAATLT